MPSKKLQLSNCAGNILAGIAVIAIVVDGNHHGFVPVAGQEPDPACSCNPASKNCWHKDRQHCPEYSIRVLSNIAIDNIC